MHERDLAVCDVVTLDAGRNVTGVFAGDLAVAHEAAVAQARSQYLLPVSKPFDVVVTTTMGYPADTTLYQAVKGMSVAAEGQSMNLQMTMEMSGSLAQNAKFE